MIAWLAALLLAGLAPDRVPVPVDLETVFERGEALDGRWVEFDAFVWLMGTRGSHPVLTAITGEQRTLPDGRTILLCADNPEAHVAIIMRDTRLGPLRRGAAQQPGAFTGVRIRGIYRHRACGYRTRLGAEHEWVASVDHAVIIRVTGQRCALTLPAS